MKDNDVIENSENETKQKENTPKDIMQKEKKDSYRKIINICIVIQIIVSICLAMISGRVLYPFLIRILKEVSFVYIKSGIAIVLCVIVLYVIWKWKTLLQKRSVEVAVQQEKETYQSTLDDRGFFEHICERIDENDGKIFLWKRTWSKMEVSPEKDSIDRDFLIHLGNVYVTALNKKKYNKSKYFALKKKAANYQNIKSFLHGFYNQKTIVAGIAGYIGTGALSVYASAFYDWIVLAGISIAVILLIAFIGFIFLRHSYYDSEIELRKFGETWVRHEATVVNLENVMMKYVMGLEEFSRVEAGIDEKRLFMEQVGKVLMDNEERFQKNMGKIQ